MHKSNKGHQITEFSDDPWTNLFFAVTVRAGRDAHFGENGVQQAGREFLSDNAVQDLASDWLGVDVGCILAMEEK